MTTLRLPWDGKVHYLLSIGVASCNCHNCRRPGNGRALLAVTITGEVIAERPPEAAKAMTDQQMLDWLAGRSALA